MKTALLIGASNFDSEDLSDIPSALKDISVMKEILADEKVGGFDKVEVLLDASSAIARQRIEVFFHANEEVNLKLLYYSGHGLLDNRDDLFFASKDTAKGQSGSISRATAIKARDIQEYMSSDIVCKQQVVILDCCFSGIFGNIWPKDGLDRGKIIRSQLGGKGRVVLTSCSSTQKSFASESGLSIYTGYLVQGIKTGDADEDKDGIITADELHKYAKKRSEEDNHTSNPKIYPYEEGYSIALVNSPTEPVELLKSIAQTFIDKDDENIIPETSELTLKIRAESLEISEEEFSKVISSIKEPIEIRRRNIRKFEEIYERRRKSISESSEKELKVLQKEIEVLKRALDLDEQDIEEIQKRYQAYNPEEFTVMGKSLYFMRNRWKDYIVNPANEWIQHNVKGKSGFLLLTLCVATSVSAGALFIERKSTDIIRARRAASISRDVETCESLNQQIIPSFAAFRALRSDELGTCHAAFKINHFLLGRLAKGKAISSLTVSPDGRLLAAGNSAGNIRLWDNTEEAPESEILRTNATRGSRVSNHTSSIYDLAFGNDGNLLFSSGGEGRIIVWDLTGSPNIKAIAAFGESELTAKLLVGKQGQRHFLVSTTNEGKITLWGLDFDAEIDEALFDYINGTPISFGSERRLGIRKVQSWVPQEERCVIDISLYDEGTLVVGSFANEPSADEKCATGSNYKLTKHEFGINPENVFLNSSELALEEGDTLVDFDTNSHSGHLIGIVRRSQPPQLTGQENAESHQESSFKIWDLSGEWNSETNNPTPYVLEIGGDDSIQAILDASEISTLDVADNAREIFVIGDKSGRVRFLELNGPDISLSRTVVQNFAENGMTNITSILLSDGGNIAFIGRENGVIEYLRVGEKPAE